VAASLAKVREFTTNYVYRPEDQYQYDINNPQPFRFDGSYLVKDFNRRFQQGAIDRINDVASARTYRFDYQYRPNQQYNQQYVYNANNPRPYTY